MKNILFALCFLCLSLSDLSAQWIFGGGMKFNSNTEFKALALNGKVGKDINEKFDANVDIAYYIESKATWSFDFDIHYKLLNLNDNFILNPVAGINFTNTSVINNSLALGLSMRVITDQYTYYLEPKWILDNKQFVLSVGVLF